MGMSSLVFRHPRGVSASIWFAWWMAGDAQAESPLPDERPAPITISAWIWPRTRCLRTLLLPSAATAIWNSGPGLAVQPASPLGTRLGACVRIPDAPLVLETPGKTEDEDEVEASNLFFKHALRGLSESPSLAARQTGLARAGQSSRAQSFQAQRGHRKKPRWLSSRGGNGHWAGHRCHPRNTIPRSWGCP